jgi:hypothetical protein
VCETNIVALHDQTPHISLPNPPFLRSRLHRFSRRRTFLSKRKREEEEEEEEEEILIIKVNKKFQKSFFLLSKNEKTFSDEKSKIKDTSGPLTDFL